LGYGQKRGNRDPFTGCFRHRANRQKITATFWDLHLFDEDDLIIETWNLMDNLAIMQQIGLLKFLK
jgi:hypothetical protein